MTPPGRGRATAVLVCAVLAAAGPAGCGSPSTGAPGKRLVSATSAARAGFTPPATGTASPDNALMDPVTVYDLADPVARYQDYVTAQLTLLTTQTATLSADVRAGNLAAARAQWLTAHLTYHRIGAAYGAFGATGKAVDGLAQGLPRGTSDPAFTGFHRVEYLLWSTGTAGAAGSAARLAADVATLQAGASTLNIPANNFTVRAHEILENTLQFDLTGQDDYGSNTSLATAGADLDGTRTIVNLLRPLLSSRAPALPTAIDHDLDGVWSALAAAGPGQPVAVSALPTTVRERLDARVDAALETLSAVPGLLEIQDND